MTFSWVSVLAITLTSYILFHAQFCTALYGIIPDSFDVMQCSIAYGHTCVMGNTKGAVKHDIAVRITRPYNLLGLICLPGCLC